jgi:hypothetical protein
MPYLICHTQDCLPAPVFMSSKGNCPVNSPVIRYSQLISAQVEQFPSSFNRGSVKKARSLPLSINGLPLPLNFLLAQSLIIPVTTFEVMPRAVSGPASGCEEPCHG